MATIAPPTAAPTYAPPADRTRAAVVPWTLATILVAATAVAVGVIWDISWHMTIGRDTFWSPPHMSTYLGAILTGAACGWLALKTTFRGTDAERAVAVRFWGFQAPLGAWVATWGALAMLTSAPFDDWWHNAYGLDVEIVSPPHTVLALGMYAIVVGAMLMTLAHQNRAEDPRARRTLGMLYLYACGLLVTMVSVFTTDWTWRALMHSEAFYQVTALAFPLFFLAAARGSALRWPATKVALAYMGVRAVMTWVLPLFEGSPKLGPIYQQVTHFVPMEFPLLLVVPALVIDLAYARWGRSGRDWMLAAVSGVGFVLAMLAAHWPFGEFLLSPASRNWVFATHRFYYAMPMSFPMVQHRFMDLPTSLASFATSIGIAMVFATLAARFGLAWGGWMARVQR